MLKIITCNKLNYKKKLFSYVNTTSINNQKRSEIVIIPKKKKNENK